MSNRESNWVSEIECSRHILWNDQWQRVDGVAASLRREHPESFRPLQVRNRKGKVQEYWAFTKCVRLKKYGRKRLVIVHEREDLSDAPRYLVTDARYWDATRVIQTWKYRWSVEVFHEFCKQVTGLESAQVRKQEAVKRHFALSCVAQSFLQNVTGTGRKSERFNFAKGTQTVGQKLHSITREALGATAETESKSLYAGTDIRPSIGGAYANLRSGFTSRSIPNNTNSLLPIIKDMSFCPLRSR